MRKYSIEWQEHCIKKGNQSAMGGMLKHAELRSIRAGRASAVSKKVTAFLKGLEYDAAIALLNKK